MLSTFSAKQWSHPSRLVLTFRSAQWAAYKLHQGLEKGFKAHKYFRDYEEDHGHDLWRMIPQVAEIRRLAEPLVVRINFRICKRVLILTARFRDQYVITE